MSTYKIKEIKSKNSIKTRFQVQKVSFFGIIKKNVGGILPYRRKADEELAKLKNVA